jgi:hypothetical protein
MAFKNCCWLTMRCFCLILICYGSSLAVCAYSHTFRIHRRLQPQTTTPSQGYQRCLKGWRQDNLGLWLLPPPLILKQGDAETGVGFVLVRVPPVGLREGILECSKNDKGNDKGNDDWEMKYAILNPGWFTWPVQEHEGRIRFSSETDNGNGDTDGGGSTVMEWSVQWTPLSVPAVLQGLFEKFLLLLTERIITTAADYVARDDN